MPHTDLQEILLVLILPTLILPSVPENLFVQQVNARLQLVKLTIDISNFFFFIRVSLFVLFFESLFFRV